MVLWSQGKTRVLCTASISEGVPRWLYRSGRGWVTAEYSLLPAATGERSEREAARGKQGGRTVEIQRLIGRAVRVVCDFQALGERTVHLDCDVLQADGGTRCASICGAYVALESRARPLRALEGAHRFGRRRLGRRGRGRLAARPRLRRGLERRGRPQRRHDRRRAASSRCRRPPNGPFDRARLDELLDLAAGGIAELESSSARRSPRWRLRSDRGVFASRNSDKLDELRAVLAGWRIDLLAEYSRPRKPVRPTMRTRCSRRGTGVVLLPPACM